MIHVCMYLKIFFGVSNAYLSISTQLLFVNSTSLLDMTSSYRRLPHWRHLHKVFFGLPLFRLPRWLQSKISPWEVVILPLGVPTLPFSFLICTWYFLCPILDHSFWFERVFGNLLTVSWILFAWPISTVHVLDPHKSTVLTFKSRNLILVLWKAAN